MSLNPCLRRTVLVMASLDDMLVFYIRRYAKQNNYFCRVGDDVFFNVVV